MLWTTWVAAPMMSEKLYMHIYVLITSKYNLIPVWRHTRNQNTEITWGKVDITNSQIWIPIIRQTMIFSNQIHGVHFKLMDEKTAYVIWLEWRHGRTGHPIMSWTTRQLCDSFEWFVWWQQPMWNIELCETHYPNIQHNNITFYQDHVEKVLKTPFIFCLADHVKKTNRLRLSLVHCEIVLHVVEPRAVSVSSIPFHIAVANVQWYNCKNNYIRFIRRVIVTYILRVTHMLIHHGTMLSYLFVCSHMMRQFKYSTNMWNTSHMS